MRFKDWGIQFARKITNGPTKYRVGFAGRLKPTMIGWRTHVLAVFDGDLFQQVATHQGISGAMDDREGEARTFGDI